MPAGHTHQLTPILHHWHEQSAVELFDCPAPPNVGQFFDRLEMRVVVGEVEVTPRGAIDELDVMIRLRRIKAPVRGNGEHDLLLKSKLFGFREDPLVWGADDRLVAKKKMRLDGSLLAEAGFFHADDVGNVAEALETLGAHDDAKLRRVIEHDREIGVRRQEAGELDYLVFGLGDHVRCGDDQEVESERLGALGLGEHVVHRGVGDVSGDEPRALRLVGHDLHDSGALVLR